MNRRMLLPLTLVLAAIVLTGPALSAPEGCVDVELSITPDPVCRGAVITADASVMNCGDRRDVVELTFTISTPFGPSFIGQTSLVLREGETRSDSISSTVPMDVPLGVYTVAVDAISRRGGADTATATVEVIDCP